jgi:transposase-like protein
MKPEDVVEFESKYDTEFNGHPVCPYCGHENEPYYDMPSTDWEEYECSKCGRTFVTMVEYEPKYSTKSFESHYLNKRKEILNWISLYKDEDKYRSSYEKQLERLDIDMLKTIQDQSEIL